jgi:nitroreductase
MYLTLVAGQSPAPLERVASGVPSPIPSSCSNSVVDTILRRRSTRELFDGRPLPHEVLMEIVRCGLAAPSSKNAQPWRLHVVSDPPLLSEFARAVEIAKGADSYVPMDPLTGKPRPDWPSTVALSAGVLRHAAAAIFVENRGTFSRGRQVLADAIQAGRVGSLIAYGFEIIGIGAAIQNMWIAAESFGVRGCYMGDIVIAEEEIAQRLGLEKDLMGVLALGYSESPVGVPSVPDLPMDATHVVWHSPPSPQSAP